MGLTLDEIREALESLPEEMVEDYESWRNVVLAVHDATDGSEEGRELARSWSMKSGKYDEAAVILRGLAANSPDADARAAEMAHGAADVDPRAHRHVAIERAVGEADLIYLSGGKPGHVSAALLGTRVGEALRAAHERGALAEATAHYRQPDVLIIDEVGYIPFEPEAANLFFQLVSSRYEHASLILTSNLPFSGWGGVFGDQAVAAAMIDRLVVSLGEEIVAIAEDVVFLATGEIEDLNP